MVSIVWSGDVCLFTLAKRGFLCREMAVYLDYTGPRLTFLDIGQRNRVELQA